MTLWSLMTLWSSHEGATEMNTEMKYLVLKLKQIKRRIKTQRALDRIRPYYPSIKRVY
jgi:hypothetical protein